MATVHFVKDGTLKNGEPVTTSVAVLASDAAENLGRFSSRYSDSPPTFNPSVQASDWAEYKHVVLEIEKGESQSPFSMPGYYYISGLTPAECKDLMRISASSV